VISLIYYTKLKQTNASTGSRVFKASQLPDYSFKTKKHHTKNDTIRYDREV